MESRRSYKESSRWPPSLSSNFPQNLRQTVRSFSPLLEGYFLIVTGRAFVSLRLLATLWVETPVQSSTSCQKFLGSWYRFSAFGSSSISPSSPLLVLCSDVCSPVSISGDIQGAGGCWISIIISSIISGFGSPVCEELLICFSVAPPISWHQFYSLTSISFGVVILMFGAVVNCSSLLKLEYFAWL